MEIVGVAGDVRYGGLEVAPEPAFYQHYQQVSLVEHLCVVLRTGSDPRPLADSVRNAIWSLDKDLPPHRKHQDNGRSACGVSRASSFPNFLAFLVLGSLALMLAMTGILRSYVVSGDATHSRNRDTCRAWGTAATVC